jgi:hypothetical protein
VSRKEVMVVGESPSINPRAKKILMEAMLHAGFEEDDFRWINVLEMSPPEGKKVTKTMIKQARRSSERQRNCCDSTKRLTARTIYLVSWLCSSVVASDSGLFPWRRREYGPAKN